MTNSNHENLWPQIKSLAEAGQDNEIQSLIENTETGKARIALFRFAVRGLMFRHWANNNLNPVILLGDAAIATALNLYQQSPQEKALQDEANIICYNMSANLAGCWNDGFTRNSEHFQKGLEYANKAIAFRTELKKGPGPFSMVLWAKAVHELFLNDFTQAEIDFTTSLRFAEEAALAANAPIGITKSADFSVLLGIGYLALVHIAQKKPGALETYQSVINAFEQMKEISEDAKGDAEVGIDQLQWTYSKLSTTKL